MRGRSNQDIHGRQLVSPRPSERMCGPMTLTSSGCICRSLGLSAARKHATDREDLSARRLQYPTPSSLPGGDFNCLFFLTFLHTYQYCRRLVKNAARLRCSRWWRRHTHVFAVSPCFWPIWHLQGCTLRMAIGPVQEHADITDFSDIVLGRIGCPKSARKLWKSTVHGCCHLAILRANNCSKMC